MALPDNTLTRIEQYLAKIAGQDTALPNIPLTRVEQYLDYIAKNIGGGGEKLVIPIDLSKSSGVIDSVSAEDYLANYDNCVFDCGANYGVVFPASYAYQEQGGQRLAMTTALTVRPRADSLATITISVYSYGDYVAFMQEQRTYEITEVT